MTNPNTEALLAALREARDRFAEYERHHLAKDPPDFGKAERNCLAKSRCDLAIHRAEQAHAAKDSPTPEPFDRRDHKTVDWVASEMARELGGDPAGWLVSATFAVEVARKAYNPTLQDEGVMSAEQAVPTSEAAEKAAWKLIQDICSCAAEVGDEAWPPHCKKEVIEPVAKVIYERDLVLSMLERSRAFMDPHGPFDTIALLRSEAEARRRVAELEASHHHHEAGGAPSDAWLPIETAPKDGSKIDLWAVFPEPEAGERRWADAFWNSEVGEWSGGDYHAGQYLHRPSFTHWRPITRPGSSEAGGAPGREEIARIVNDAILKEVDADDCKATYRFFIESDPYRNRESASNNAADAILALFAKPDQQGREQVGDAERWRALMRCGRIKMQGSAGVDPHTGERNGSGVHFGAEFWPEHLPDDYRAKHPEEAENYDRNTRWGVACLIALADAIIERDALAKSRSAK